MISAGKQLVVAANSTNEHEFQFGARNRGRLSGMYFNATDNTFGVEIVENAKGKVHFAGFTLIGDTWGSAQNKFIPFEDGIPVGPGASVTIRLQDGSGSENTIDIVLVGVGAEE